MVADVEGGQMLGRWTQGAGVIVVGAARCC
jgi:hypothetical protein